MKTTPAVSASALTLCAFLCVAAVWPGHTASAAEPASAPAVGVRGFEQMEKAMDSVAEQVKAAMAKEGGKTVAVVPFIDNRQGIYLLGQRAAELLEGSLVNRKVEVAERSRLDALLKEKKAWMMDLFEGQQDGKTSPTTAFLKADYLVLGEMEVGPESLLFTVKLVEVASGSIKGSAKPFSVNRNPQLNQRLVYVQRPEKTDGYAPPVPWMEVTFTVMGERRTGDGTAKREPLKEGDTLRSKDQFHICFEPVSDCWVYVFLLDSSGKCGTLFPYPGVKMDNHCCGGISYTLPDKGNPMRGEPDARSFVLDETPGTETIYVVASYSPMTDLAAVVKAMEKSPDDAGSSKRVRQAIKDFDAKSAKQKANPKGVKVVDVQAGPAKTEAVGQVLRGRFVVVKEFKFQHR